MLVPENEESVLDFLRAGQPVHAIGNGTKQHLGPALLKEAEVVSLRKLDRITSYEPGDLVVTVQAGVRLGDLQSALAEHNQWLPVDPPFGNATIGGVLATNSSGPRRLGYGTLRDHLIGLKVAGPGGVVTRSGGRVVKNVTGFDLHKLHIGAFGSLGVLLEANFKLRPRPEISAAFVLSCESVEEAHTLLLKVHDSRLRPVALEAMDGRLRHIVEAKALAIVGVEGSRPVIDRHFRELRELGRPMGVLEGERADSVWNAFRKLPEALEDFVRVRIGMKPHDLSKVLPSAPQWISVGTGIARVDLQPGPDVAKKIQQWNDKAANYGGYAVAESAPVSMPGREKLPWGTVDSPLMRSIRNSRDPRGVLARGRMPV
ncbi:MAG TPA: FAD-binding oxidoreductase [Planctomycetota bacterium]|nr:FAD-binding oxidoreductase [Planctomycetota bacterium]